MALMFLNGTAMSGQKDHSAHRGSTFLARPTLPPGTVFLPSVTSSRGCTQWQPAAA